MTQKEFSELCKTSYVTKCESEDYGDIKIFFDNGVIVEIGKTTEWDCAVFEFDTNIEQDQRQKDFNERNIIEVQKRNEFEINKEKIRAKYTDGQWAEIEQAFLYNNGMTYEQNIKSQEQMQQFYKSMYNKYSSPESKEFFGNFLNNTNE